MRRATALVLLILASLLVSGPARADWLSGGVLATGRADATATLLPDGRVLVAGGENPNNTSLASAEIYDPVTNSWSSAANMNQARRNHSATLLPNGKVLVAGGLDSFDLSTVELYDPVGNTWSP
ncbi:MAG: hypothetical protein E6G40_06685, partial [Actinobacteria bacterium]